MALEVHVSLTLPRDEVTVPVARHLCDMTMQELGVSAQCRADVALALTEACTNVVEHSSADHPYAVNITLDERRCSIRVMGGDSSVDLTELERSDGARIQAGGKGRPGVDAERGRGVDLMHRLVDRVAFTTEPEEGVIVHLQKDLDFEDGHPVTRRLLR
jgi:serine/threonine-protein kinase RsbW